MFISYFKALDKMVASNAQNCQKNIHIPRENNTEKCPGSGLMLVRNIFKIQEASIDKQITTTFHIFNNSTISLSKNLFSSFSFSIQLFYPQLA